MNIDIPEVRSEKAAFLYNTQYVLKVEQLF